MPLTITDRVKEYLDINQNEHKWDVLIERLIAAADNIVREYLGYDPLDSVSGLTEYPETNGSDVIFLRRHLPVRSITSIHEDTDGWFGLGTNSPFASTDLLTEGDDYAWERDDPEDNTRSRSGMIRRLRGSNPDRTYGWPKEAGSVQVIYVGGYTVIPKGMEQAAIMKAAALTKRAMDGAGGRVSAERLGEWSISYAVPTGDAIMLTEAEKALLWPYKRVEFA